MNYSLKKILYAQLKNGIDIIYFIDNEDYNL